MLFFHLIKNTTWSKVNMINSNKKHIYQLMSIFTNYLLLLSYYKICLQNQDKYDFLNDFTNSKRWILHLFVLVS